jgi:beta-glucosidase
VSVTVTNTGRRTGWAVPELYLGLPALRGVPQPPNQLKGFSKVQLAPGESRRVSMRLDARAFSYWSDSENGWRVARGCVKVHVGSSSHSLPLRARLAVGGASC